MHHETGPQPSRAAILGAFLIVYVVWGSTYLGIKIAIETMPPLLMAGLRFTIAGAVLYAVAFLAGERLGALVHWKHAAVIGTALLAGGNGGVTWAERSVPSSIAALVIGSAPLWFALVGWAWPGGKRPAPRTWAGIVLGLLGLAALVSPSGAPGGLPIGGMLILLGACLSWASGSIYSRHVPRPASPWMGIAAQMLCGGVVLLAASTLVGEPRGFDWSRVSTRSWGALAYLIVVGSWVGFSAYIWLLRVCSPTSVSSYAYVNPVVAVLLGWAILDEPITTRTLTAAGIILLAVMVLTLPQEWFDRVARRLRRRPRNPGIDTA